MHTRRGRKAMLLALLPLALAGGCRTAEGTGTLIGAGSGALLGNAVGKAVGGSGNGARTVGTLIGTGVGAVAGNAIGRNMDEAEHRGRAEGYAAATAQPPVSLNEVVDMARAGVPDSVIINKLRTSGTIYPNLTTQEITWLTREGVSSPVVNELMSARAQRVYQAGPVYPPPPPVGVGVGVGFNVR